jgi:hypothetical protein
MLLQEEMRRVVAYLYWKGDWWVSQAERRQGQAATDILNGLRGYAYRQAAFSRQLATNCLEYWVNGLKELGLNVAWALSYEGHLCPLTNPAQVGDGGQDSDSDENEEEVDEDGGLHSNPIFYLDTDMYTV